MYCCYDPTTQLNKLSPIKAWIPEKKIMSLRPIPLAWLARVLRGQLTKFSGNSAVGHSISIP